MRTPLHVEDAVGAAVHARVPRRRRTRSGRRASRRPGCWRSTRRGSAARRRRRSRAAATGTGCAQTSSPMPASPGAPSSEPTHVHPEAAALDLAAVHRQVRVAEDEAADDVGAARDRLQAAASPTCSRTQSYCRRAGPSRSTAPRAGAERSSARARRVAARPRRAGGTAGSCRTR